MADVLERDAGFCSGGEDDDMEAEDGIHSPTDASEDSVDVKVQAISFRNRNKRKCAEPRKLDSDLPAKKRKIDLTATEGEVETSNRNPFRPWSASPPTNHKDDSHSVRFSSRINLPFKSEVGVRTKSFEPLNEGQNELDVISMRRLSQPENLISGTQSPTQKLISIQLPEAFSAFHQEEPLSLVSKRKDSDCDDVKVPTRFNQRLPKSRNCTDNTPDVRVPLASPAWYASPKDLSQAANKTPSVGRVNDRGSYLSNRAKLTNGGKTNIERKSKQEIKTKSEECSHQSDNKFRIDSLLSSVRTEGNSSASTSKSSQTGQQRNYKNMTRERRIEANARERTRVHTISAAFDTLRHSIPAYSHNQKLSKLSVLRIACSYIMTLSRLAGYDYSKDQSEPDLSNCVENVSKTIQTEGKIRKKRDD